jgi:hypothetical protein
VISRAAPAVLFVLLAACSRGGADSRSAPDPQPVPSAALSPAPKGTLALGEPVTSPLVPLADIAKSPARYENQLVATSGRVTAVCQEMGCWMEIQDETGQAHVKMHGHAFFVPKSASGHVARVQAKVLRRSDESCSDSPPPKRIASAPKVELDAIGVELD